MRQSWDEYFLGIARVVATRATCDRKHVGAVIVRDKYIVATGYNGSAKGAPHCDDAGHDMQGGHCIPGDVVISKMQTGHYNTGHRSVRQIFEQWQHPRKRGAMMRMLIRSANEAGILVSDRIVDIWSMGVKSLVSVSTRLGRTVRTTEDHLFKVPGGWSPIGALSAGSRVALNGRPLYDDPVWLRAKYEIDGLDQVGIARLLGCNRKTISKRLDSFGIARREHKLGGWNTGLRGAATHSYRGREVRPTSARTRARRYALGVECIVCASRDGLQVHHVDGDVWNDAAGNLVTLCIECHNLAHTQHAKRESIVYDEITSIRPAGEEEVFDLQTEKYHNFVGNGFVLHNCLRTVHAEVNAIAQAARHGARLEGCTIYVTCTPCSKCLKVLANAGIVRIVYAETYRNEAASEEAAQLGIVLERLKGAAHANDI